MLAFDSKDATIRRGSVMRTPILLTLLVGVLLSTGCTMCSPGFLCDYAGVGGKWQRTDPANGRVGSSLSDAGEVMSESIPTSTVGYETNGLLYEDASESSPMEMDYSNGSDLVPELVPSVEDGAIILGE
jgi:hypothetical protein